MSKVINYDTNRILVIRDNNNVHFYSKENLEVSGINGNVVLIDNNVHVEVLPSCF